MEKITKKIKSAKLVDKIEEVEVLTNKKRPYVLSGYTYSIKTKLLKHTLYVTINNIEENGTIRPFEIFLKSKDNRKYMELDIFSKLLSSSFRRESNICYLVDDIKSTNSNADGVGYFRPPRLDHGEVKGKFVPSIYYEIGEVIEDHLKNMNVLCAGKLMLENTDIDSYVEQRADVPDVDVSGVECPECGDLNVQMVGGCKTCLVCGWSACG